MRKYRHYIFDLYGTLLDIHTDQKKPMLWRRMADLYGCYGAGWAPQEMRRAYQRMCAEEETRLAEMNGSLWPEITLERVFVRLLLEAPSLRESRLLIEGKSARSWREVCCGGPERSREERRYDPEMLPDRLVHSDWVQCVASEFRLLSICHLRLYPDTLETLQTIRQKGGSLWLLSNAQRCFTVQELEQAGLWDLFDGIRISSDAGVRKPDPLFMRSLLDEEGLDPADCLMIGNERESDMAVAAACGVDGFYLEEDGHSLPLLLKEVRDA